MPNPSQGVNRCRNHPGGAAPATAGRTGAPSLGAALLAMLMAAGSAEAAFGLRVTSTLYVSPQFEVRDQDQPVKYVLNGATRVARLTGSLASNERIQRLRLRAGWNLVSLAVAAPDLPGQLRRFSPGIDEGSWLLAAYRWCSSSGEYRAVGDGENVAAGTVLWLHARAPLVVPVRGEYAPPAAPTIPAGGAFVPGAGLEVWPLQLPAGVTVWRFDAASRGWQAGFTGDLAPVSQVPPELAPGEAIHVHTAETVELAIPDSAFRVAYYHPDHLGSSSVITDAAGRLLEETAHHPFGVPRHRHQLREAHPHYGFTQKERDRESGFHYFEARYLAGSLARFLSYDPLIQRLEALEDGELMNVLTQPAKLNPFVYAMNNPARYVDPDGRDARPRPNERPRPAEDRSQQPDWELVIRIGPSPKHPAEISALSFGIDLNRAKGATPGRTGGNEKGHETTTDFQITRRSDEASTALLQKQHQGHHIKSVLLIVPGKDGKQLFIEMRDVFITGLRPLSVEGEPIESLTLSAGSTRLFDPEAKPTPREPRAEWRIDPRTNQ